MDLLNENTIRQIIAGINSSQNKERREREIKASQVYSGALSDHVKLRLKDIYPKTHSSFSVADLNLSSKITNKRAKAYKTNPKRTLENDIESEVYSNLLEDLGAAKAWQTFDVYYNLHRYACMWFTFTNKEDGPKFNLRPLNPSQFSRVVDNSGDTKIFIVNFPDQTLFFDNDTDGIKSVTQDSAQDSYDRKRYGMWTDNQHIVVSVGSSDNGIDDVIFEPIEGNEMNINPLGVIPAVFAQEGDNSVLPIINPLTDQVIEFSQQYSVLLTGSSLQTFGHLILSHPEDQPAPSEIYNSLFTYSTLPQRENGPATTLDYLNPGPNLSAQLEVIRDYGHQIITEHLGDGSNNLKDTQTFSSGLDRLISMADLTNIIESNRSVYAKSENELYNIIRAFFEANNSFIFRSENLTVEYGKAKPIQGDEELLRVIEKKLSLGLIEKYEAILELNPNMGEEAARDKVLKIQEDNFSEARSFIGETNADQEE